jgi:hypothetical protein
MSDAKRSAALVSHECRSPAAKHGSHRLRVLLVGGSDPIHLAHCAFLSRHLCAISTAADYRELRAIPAPGPCDIAMLQFTLSGGEPQDSPLLVGCRWPSARILIVRNDAQFLEDALYDDLVTPDIDSGALLSVIHGLTGRLRSLEVQRM